MKYLITGVFLFINLNVFSQIKLHQPTEQTQYFLKYLVEGHYNWKVDTKYNDGTITEIVIYQHKEFFYDLNTIANARIRYIMKDGRLNNILTQFENLSTDYVKKQFDEYYSETKISNYYFTKDYQEYRTISKIGKYASINHQSVNFEDFDLEVSEEIKRRRRLYYNELNGITEEETDTTEYEYDDSFEDELAHNEYMDSVNRDATIYTVEQIKKDDSLVLANPLMSIQKWARMYVGFEKYGSNIKGAIKCLVEKEGTVSKSESLGYHIDLEKAMIKRLNKLTFEPAYIQDDGFQIPIRSYFYVIIVVGEE